MAAVNAGDTLTEANARNPLQVSVITRDPTMSSARVIPYAEIYRQSSGLMPNPIDRLQQAAEDTERRARSQ